MSSVCGPKVGRSWRSTVCSRIRARKYCDCGSSGKCCREKRAWRGPWCLRPVRRWPISCERSAPNWAYRCKSESVPSTKAWKRKRALTGVGDFYSLATNHRKPEFRNFEISSRRTKTSSISGSYCKELTLGLLLALVILDSFQCPRVYQFYVSHYEKSLQFLIEVDNAPRKRGTILRRYIVLDRIVKVVYDG